MLGFDIDIEKFFYNVFFLLLEKKLFCVGISLDIWGYVKDIIEI